jgi:hypothetical protein
MVETDDLSAIIRGLESEIEELRSKVKELEFRTNSIHYYYYTVQPPSPPYVVEQPCVPTWNKVDSVTHG